MQCDFSSVSFQKQIHFGHNENMIKETIEGPNPADPTVKSFCAADHVALKGNGNAEYQSF